MNYYQKAVESFKLFKEKEDFNIVVANIDSAVAFKGTNLWILIFAIFLASLGLNVNSTAVIIGAMLISPLMGPIIGLGLGVGINDFSLVRKALFNYIFSAIIGLITSTIYFSLTPLNEAHSEILARISPNIYDVLIAFFGGLAGILAISSKMKGNVIPGVAIATALMPPLCTAGYGIATLQPNFLFGALYLFVINTVFIALATIITVRLLKFPVKHFPDLKSEKRARHLISIVVLITLIPSIYFGYDIVQQTKFSNNANSFIKAEAVLPNDYLLKENINPKAKSITLIFGGKKIRSGEIDTLRGKLKKYELEDAHLEIKQGFAYLTQNNNDKETMQISKTLSEQDSMIQLLKAKVDSLQPQKAYIKTILKEATAICPDLTGVSILPFYSEYSKDKGDSLDIIYMEFSRIPGIKIKNQLENWLRVRLNRKVKMIMEK